jgi:TonB-dependent SusC/RagA subfamily outer membrane receptor
MRQATRLFFFLPLLLIGFLLAFQGPEDDLLDKLITRLSTFQQSHSQEKVYLHLDKPYYVAGEDIWYKAYLADARSHAPDTLSRNIYVELISPAGEIVKKNILQVRAGFAHGDFDTADTLAAGRYQIRAYTNWMRNFPGDYFFHQDIHIWNKPQATPVSAKSRRVRKTGADASEDLPELEVRFFPEGGNLVSGLFSIIGIKAWNRQGAGQDISGAVYDEAGKEITAFKTTHLGMGSFMFLPQAGKTYTARVQTGDGRSHQVAFPPIQAQGLVMRINSLFKDKIQVLVSQHALAGVPGRELILIGHIRGTLCCSARGKAIQDKLVFTIPKTNLPGGIIQFTLFDAVTGEPLNERLVFNRAVDQLKLEVKSDKSQYMSRELVTLDISATTPEGLPATANLSLAVTDGAIQPAAHARNLVNYLLLGSDLQGVVEQPGFYFQDNGAGTVQALDNLMLTQGWRRFVWKQVLEETRAPLQFYPEQHITISGKINRLLTNKPLANAEVLLFTSGKQGYMIQAKTNDAGRFLIEGLVFDSVTSLYVQAKNEKGKLNTTVVLDEMTTPPLRFLSPEATEAPSPLSEEYLQRMRSHQQMADAYMVKSGQRVLKEVLVTAKKEAAEPTQPRMYGTADKVIKMTDQMGSYSSILQVLQGRVAGLLVSGDNVSIRGGGTPLFLLDESPVELDMILGISPMDVETIEILKGATAAVYGSRGGNGVIAIFTKRGPSVNSNYQQSGTTTAKLQGYTKTREFFAPSYAQAKEEHNLPDLRSTLYWNPVVKTDSQGKARVSFYNADKVPNLRLIVEGISPGGLPGSQTLLIGPKQ